MVFFYTIKAINLEYFRPARMDDRLKIRSTVEIVGRAKAQLRFHQEIDNLTSNVSPMTKANLHIVCVNPDMRPTPMPKKLLEKIDV